MSEEARRAAAEVGAAIDRAVGADLVIKWVALVEVVDATSEEHQRGVWALTPENATPWDMLGLLEWAKNLEWIGQMEQQLGDPD